MTKSQIWVSAFLGLFILLFLLSRLTKDEDTNTNAPEQNTVPQGDLSSENLSAPELMSKLGCTTCHGSDFRGSRMGPGLYGISQYWSRDKLINYFRNPASYADTERFKEHQQKYPGLMMPSFSNIDVKELGKIADYLMELK